MADILFTTGEGGLHAVLHAPLGQFYHTSYTDNANCYTLVTYLLT